ncbi:MAG TPA: ATP-dependent DNA ligase [Candidatus Thermoplasmatota archaeon]|nr:ATP-dependent DNA ligase [Candidatus Thermoplasmatota archaeon]
MRFADVAQAAERVGATRGTHAKRDAVAEILRAADDESLPHVARFLSGSPFARSDPRLLQVGWSAIGRAALATLPVDELTWRACHRAVGDTGETLALLLDAHPPARRGAQRTLFEDDGEAAALSVLDVAATYARLAAATPAAKPRLLEEAWRRMTSVEAKYFTKILTGGMRIGLAESLVEEAIAAATGADVAEVRQANMVSGDVGETALLARRGRLSEAAFRLFHPMGFMLASPVEEPPEDVAERLVEDKYDGIRAQLHVADGRAEIYTRTLEKATEFPELLDAARKLPHALVLDGEVIAVRADGTPAPFALLQRRLGRKSVAEVLRRQVPVRFVAYDALYVDGETTYKRPLAQRRAVLEALPLSGPLSASPARRVASVDEAKALFEAARGRGNEGLMFKSLGAPYEFGKRGQSWLKLKRPFATLDVVVTAAEVGHGKRAGLLSDVTFAVRGPGGALLNVGKAYTGLTNEEIARMTTILKSITYERHASVHLVHPEIVLEVAFDSVTRSERHKSGFALRFPRIVRWRKDKPLYDVDTLERVEELWRLSGGAETIDAPSRNDI